MFFDYFEDKGCASLHKISLLHSLENIKLALLIEHNILGLVVWNNRQTDECH